MIKPLDQQNKRKLESTGVSNVGSRQTKTNHVYIGVVFFVNLDYLKNGFKKVIFWLVLEFSDSKYCVILETKT